MKHAAVLAAVLAWGDAGAQPDAAVRTALPQAAQAGSARLKYWGFDVYDARLWVAPGFRQADFSAHAFALELAYLRPFSAADIARRSVSEMRRAGEFDDAQAARWARALEKVLPDVRKGDRVTGLNRPGAGAVFLVNGARAGEIADPHFARLFFAIWLGPATSEPAMRAALLEGTTP